jgi:hypothetical protein
MGLRAGWWSWFGASHRLDIAAGQGWPLAMPTIINAVQWKLWLYGLVSGFIGGGATALTSSGIFSAAHQAGMDVPLLNIQSMGLLWLGGGIWTAAAYLAKSPLPAIDMEALKRQTYLAVESAKLSGDPEDVQAATTAIAKEQTAVAKADSPK